MTKQRQAQSRWAVYLATKRHSLGLDYIRSRSVVHQIASNLRPDCTQELVRIVIHSDQYEFDLTIQLVRPTRSVTEMFGIEGIADQHIAAPFRPRWVG